MPRSNAERRSYDDMLVGDSRQKEYVITREVYDQFLALFNDASPLHIDDEYAQACQFNAAIMHGAILNGFISNFVGMHFPGGRGMELSVDIRFQRPCYLGDTILLHGQIAQKVDAHQVVVVHISFTNVARSTSVANARVQIKMMPV